LSLIWKLGSGSGSAGKTGLKKTTFGRNLCCLAIVTEKALKERSSLPPKKEEEKK
jgi:hypothetical protein